MNQRHKTHERPSTAQRRQEILTAAAEVFGQRGSARGTLEEIAEKVGMTRAGVLHHFGSKNNLLLQTVIFRDTEDVEEYQSGHMPEGTDTFRHLIKTARLNAARPGIVKAFVTLTADATTEDSPGNAYFVERYRNLRRELKDALLIMASERGKTIDEDTATLVAMTILAIMDGLQLQWVLDPERVDLAKETERAIKLVLAGVLDLDDEQRNHILDPVD